MQLALFLSFVGQITYKMLITSEINQFELLWLEASNLPVIVMVWVPRALLFIELATETMQDHNSAH